MVCRLLAAVASLILLVPLAAQDRPAPPGPVYYDDDAFCDKFVLALTDLAKDKKCLAPDVVTRKVSISRRTKLSPVAPRTAPLTPEEVYEKALPGVFVMGSVRPDEKSKTGFADGVFASAWVLAADGILVTNWHVFDKLKSDHFGACDHTGKVYPLTDILAVDKTADVAVVKVAAEGLTPLPLASAPAKVGAWVGVLSHPGNQLFTFTQGTVTRYCRNQTDDKKTERWMNVSADYAGGSSGGPVLDRFGNVVGMATLTTNIDFADEDEDGKPKPDKEKAKKDEPPPSTLQMVVKSTVPATVMRTLIDGRRK
jgi:serine protease Do